MPKLRLYFLILAIAALAAVAIAMPSSASTESGWEQTGVKYSQCPRCLPPAMDAVILRPIALAAGLGTTAIFVATSPFALLGNDMDGTTAYFNSLVGAPFRYVFVHPLGTH